MPVTAAPRAYLTAGEVNLCLDRLREAVERGELPPLDEAWLADLEGHLAARVGISRKTAPDEALAWLDAFPSADGATEPPTPSSC